MIYSHGAFFSTGSYFMNYKVLSRSRLLKFTILIISEALELSVNQIKWVQWRLHCIFVWTVPRVIRVYNLTITQLAGFQAMPVQYILTSNIDLSFEASSPTIRSLIWISPTLAVDRITGRPTNDGKMCAGKFEPANPHLTNWNKSWMQLIICVLWCRLAVGHVPKLIGLTLMSLLRRPHLTCY